MAAREWSKNAAAQLVTKAALTMGKRSHQDLIPPTHQRTIFHLLSPEVVTLILTQVLLGKKGIRDFESLLLAYPHLHDLVLFVTDSRDKDWILNQCPFRKLFNGGQGTDALYPVSLRDFKRKTVSSICSPSRALKVFVFQELDRSVMYNSLTTDRTCPYGRFIIPGSFVVSCAYDKRLFGHQNLVTLAKSCGAFFIHHPTRFNSNSLSPQNKPTLVDGSSPYFLFANSQWVEESRLCEKIRSTSRRLYDQKSIDSKRNNVIEIDNCHHLRYGTLETSHANRFRIKMAPGCRNLHGKEGCIAPVIKITGPVRLVELTIDYESERLPEIHTKGTLYTRRSRTGTSRINTLTLRSKNALLGPTRDEPEGQICQHHCREHAWSIRYREIYFKLTQAFQVFNYDSVPDCVIRATNFMEDVVEIEISNLQPAESAYYDSTGKPAPHHIQSSNLKWVSISAVVTKETMHRLPRFWLDHSVQNISLEQLDGSDQFWDLEWLFSGRTVQVANLVFTHTCGIETEYMSIKDVSALECIDRHSLRFFSLSDGYKPEFLWSGKSSSVDIEINHFPRLEILCIDINDMPVPDIDTFGRDLQLKEYFPNLGFLRLSDRLSRSCKWTQIPSLELHTPDSFRLLHVGSGIPFKGVRINGQQLPITAGRCRPVPFLFSSWDCRPKPDEDKNNANGAHIWRHEIACEWDWSQNV